MDTERFELQLSAGNAPADCGKYLIQVGPDWIQIALVNDGETTAEAVMIQRIGTRMTQISHNGKQLDYGEPQMPNESPLRHVLFANSEKEACDYRERFAIPATTCIVPRNVGDVATLFKRNCSLHFIGKWSSNPDIYAAYEELLRRPE